MTVGLLLEDAMLVSPANMYCYELSPCSIPCLFIALLGIGLWTIGPPPSHIPVCITSQSLDLYYTKQFRIALMLQKSWYIARRPGASRLGSIKALRKGPLDL